MFLQGGRFGIVRSVMDLESFIEEVGGSLEEVPVGGLQGDTDFKGLPCWDSLAVLTVTDSIEMEYGVLLKKEDYHNCGTLEELYTLVSSRRNG